jgi:hypothetical protein
VIGKGRVWTAVNTGGLFTRMMMTVRNRQSKSPYPTGKALLRDVCDYSQADDRSGALQQNLTNGRNPM